MHPCDNLHECALSRTIFTDHRMDALWLDFKGDLPQSLNPGEMLGDSVYL
jgi:hypothetical protein